MSDIHSAATSPFPIDSDFRDVDSRPSSRMIATGKTIRGTDGDLSITYIDSTSDPEAQLKFNIRAHSIEVSAAHQQAIAEQTCDHAALQVKERAWNAIPIYHFSQRAKLYNAFIKAQIRFNKSTSLIRLKQAHADYLDVLSKSSLSPEEQHVKYSAFKKALELACRDRRIAGSSEELSIGCPSEFLNRYATKYEANRNAAIQSEKLVQKFLKELQQPNTELRNNLAANLQYRQAQLWHQADKSSLTAQTLREEMKASKSFLDAGGLDSLSSEEAIKLNKLFKDAIDKYKIFQKESIAYKQSTSPTTSSDALHEAEKVFKTADALMMAEIKKFSDLLKGPPQLRKELTVHLKHNEALKTAVGAASVPEIDAKIETLKRFLSSPQLASIKPEQASQLVGLIRRSNEAYAAWEQLEVNAKALEATATKAEAEASKKATEKTKKPAQEAAQKARAAATAARAKADAAKPESAEADADVIKEINLLAPPEIFYAGQDNSAFESRLPLAAALNSNPSSPLITSSAIAASNVSTAIAPSTSVSSEDVRSLWRFAEKLQNSRFPDTLKFSESSKKQLAILQKFLALDETLLTALPPTKLRDLVDRMNEIVEKNKLHTTASEETLPRIEKEKAALENQFIAALEA